MWTRSLLGWVAEELRDLDRVHPSGKMGELLGQEVVEMDGVKEAD